MRGTRSPCYVKCCARRLPTPPTPRSPNAREGRPVYRRTQVLPPSAQSARASDRFAVSLKPVIAEIRAKGAKSQIAIAKELNNLGHRTQKGSQWDSNSVGALLGRQAALNRRSDSASSVGLDAEINERSSVVTAHAS